MKRNKVYLAGAGPGDPSLVTLRTLDLIKTADVIIYDSLVNPALLCVRKHDALLLYRGKRGGKMSAEQDEIHELILKYYNDGKSVLRLKGGDPWLFSRGGEEALFLAEHNVPFEIVPGVTSALAAPAYAGIPISHRNFSSSIAIATGRPRSDLSFDDMKFPDADTIIFLMPVENLPKITERLIKSGKPKDMPAALIQDGTLGKQRTLTGKLGDIAATAKKENIESPALFIVGNSISMRSKLRWFESLPLFGKNLVLARPDENSEESIKLLTNLGANVIHLPVISMNETDCEAKRFAEHLDKATDIIFTSTCGVRLFFKNLFDIRNDSRSLCQKNICAIGSKTGEELKKYGIMADLIPHEYSSTGLLDMLPQRLANRTFLLPRAAEAGNLLEEELCKREALVLKLPLYKIEMNERIDIDLNKTDGVILTSSLTAKYFIENYGWPENAVAFCIGKPTAQEINDKDIQIIVSPVSTIESMAETIVNYYSR